MLIVEKVHFHILVHDDYIFNFIYSSLHLASPKLSLTHALGQSYPISMA